MPKEAIDYLDERVTELFHEIRDLRTQMHSEHAELKEEVLKLKHVDKAIRWAFAAGGGLIAVLIKELISRLL